MATILSVPLTDGLGLALNLSFDDKSDARRLGLKALESKVSGVVRAGNQPLDQVNFASALLGGTFENPSIDLGQGVTLGVKTGVNTSVTIHRSADETLFASGDASPEITISKTQAWVGFGIDTSLRVEVGALSPSGLGVSGKAMEAIALASYTLLESTQSHFPTLKESLERALSNFRILRSAYDIRSQPIGTVCEWDVSGTFAIEGSFTYPLAANPFCLATAALPLHNEMQIGPTLEMALKGALAITGEFRGRCYRASATKVQLGLYKKKESELAASFEAEAGFGATVGSTDLLAKLFGALPGADLKLQIPEADRKTMEASLKSALDTGFSIAVNASCSGSVADEAAVLYEIDLSGDTALIDAALNGALKGNWTRLNGLPAAKELRNIAAHTHESGWTGSLNLLGIYNSASTADFLRQCTILHNLENGEVTITDKQTAGRISVASMPFLTHDEKLRKVLDECFLATVTYTAGGTHVGTSTATRATESLLLYHANSSYAALRKALLLGKALDVLSAGDTEGIAREGNVRYFHLSARIVFEGDDALRLFFSDVSERTPRDEDDLKKLGREILASLLDRNDPVDNARWTALTNDAVWANMQAQKFPRESPASYSDWYDITFWAHALATVAPLLARALTVAGKQGSGDPVKDPEFMQARTALAKAIADAATNTKAAFEKGWPLAILFALAGRRAPVSFEAGWNSKQVFARQPVKALTA